MDNGHVKALIGSQIDLARSSFVIPHTGIPKNPARFYLSTQGRLTAALVILNLETFNVLRNLDLSVSFAQDRANVQVVIETRLGQNFLPDQWMWYSSPEVRNVKSDLLIPNRTITASTLQVLADVNSLVVRGPVELCDIDGVVSFLRSLEDGAKGTARIKVVTSIGPTSLDAFNINLPLGMVMDQAAAQLSIDLSSPNMPKFHSPSDLFGTRFLLPGLGWSKARDVVAALTIAGHLGEKPPINELSITAPSLQITTDDG